MNVRSAPALFLFLLVPVAVLGQEAEVVKIAIGSYWGGIQVPIVVGVDRTAPSRPEPEETQLVIQLRNGHYEANGERVDQRLVRQLLDAVNAPPLRHQTLLNLGVTQAWLDQNAYPALREYSEDVFTRASPMQLALYRSTFRSLRVIAAIIRDLMSEQHTDDYPLVEVRIVLASGRTIDITSEEQPSFMLPWTIKRQGRTFVTHNAEISRSLAALMPENFNNRERLAGENFRRELASEVMDRIETKWRSVGSKSRRTRINRARRFRIKR